jgi:diacylglycerol O-acyltransferase
VAGPIPLTALESSFLSIERPGLPMHVAGVVVFDAAGGLVTAREVRRLIKARLGRLPRFRQRVASRWLGLARPEWVDVGDLDVDTHLLHHRLRSPGGPAQLNELCGRIHEELLPRDRPLWQVHLVDGLSGGRQALIVKTHHAITDGIAGIQIAEVLFDRAGGRRWTGGGLPLLHFSSPAGASVFGIAQGLLGLAFTVAGGPIASPTLLNRAVGAHRGFAHTTVSMGVIRDLKRRLGGSVDDVLLALVAAGMARDLARIGGANVPHALRAMLPVSTRPTTERAHVGNKVSAVFIDLPLDTTDLAVLVRRIAASKSVLRGAHAAAGMSMLIEAAGRLPHPLHRLAARVASALPVANLVVSDVPGPDAPLFFLGRPILACYPMIPLAASVGLSVAAISLGGQMGIGIVADPHVMPRPQRLAQEIQAVVRSQRPPIWRVTSVDRAHRRAA